MKDDEGNSKGYAFVVFKKADDAMRAKSELNGLDIAGKKKLCTFC